MSILLESKNCVLISHEKYIKEIYKEISNLKPTKSYKLKPELFEINSPFKHQANRKRKQDENYLKEYKTLREDSKHVKEKYEEFLETLKSKNVFPKAQSDNNDNKTAIQCAETVLNTSGENLLTNSVGRNEAPNPILINLNNNDYLFPKNCEFFAKDTQDFQGNLFGKFHTIVLDPPWFNKAIKRKRLKLNDGYNMMENNLLKEIPIEDFLGPNGIVFVWCTNSPTHLNTLINEIFLKWGVEFVGKWFWMKITNFGQPIINFAEPPGKLPFEQIVIGARNPSRELRESVGKVIVSVPSALHSHKPPLEEVLREFVGDEGRKLEIFARYLLPGWTSYGLEVLRLQNKCLYDLYDDV